MKTKLKLFIIVFVLTATTVTTQAQIYHEECKEDLRALMRQRTNYEKLGLEISDTLSWYENEEWISKLPNSEYRKITWIETDFLLRIDSVLIYSLFLEGKFKLSSPVLVYLNCFNNRLTSLDVTNNIYLRELQCGWNNLTELHVNNNIEHLVCNHNNFKFSTLPILNIPRYNYLYSPQDTIYGGIKEYTDTIDLSSEYMINGHITSYEWFDITDGTEQEIEQPTNENGIFYFAETHANKRLRCNMKNAQFPGDGSGDLPFFTLVYETEITNSIKGTTLISSFVMPNITSNYTTLTLDLESAGNLNITVNNIHGQELFELYNAFENAGTFIKTFSIETLPIGMYYIVISHKGSMKIEKIIRN